MGSPPWEAVFSTDASKMLGGKENTVLLADLLEVHIAPPSKEAIKRARKSFKDVRGKVYPISEDELALRLPKADTPPPAADVVFPEEISEGPEIVLPDAATIEGDIDTASEQPAASARLEVPVTGGET
jgi:hypothetical protein